MAPNPPSTRVQLARILVSLPALFLAIGPPIADFNATHVANPLWPPHARLHTVWLICTNSSIALFSLFLLWGRAKGPTREAVLLATGLLGLVLLGFFAAAATQAAYGGALADANGIPVWIGGLDANLVAFSVLAGVLLTAAGAVVRRAA